VIWIRTAGRFVRTLALIFACPEFDCLEYRTGFYDAPPCCRPGR
jgi:hypothetical protein